MRKRAKDLFGKAMRYPVMKEASKHLRRHAENYFTRLLDDRASRAEDEDQKCHGIII
jgi:hypothetical protein